MDNQDKITYFAETDFRNTRTKFGIKAKDRTRHMYIIGKTGMGKSTLLENLAIQDIQNDEGIIFIDPHGSAAIKLLDYVPKHRIDDVVYFAPADTDFPISFNVLEQVPKDKRNAVASGLMNAFKKIWVDAWSSRMEYLLNYSLLALLDVPGSTLLGINRLLSDKEYRKHIIDQVEDPIVKNFWNNEFTKYNDKYASEAVAPIQNKIGQFISNPLVRNIIGQEKSTIDFRKIMDEKKILIINLSKGLMGPENMRLLGGMLVTKIYLAAMSRADMSDAQMGRMPACYMYVDEFQNFANESFAEILSESRKYKLALTVANQYIEQMTDEVKAAIFGNIGSMISFRVGPTDAEFLEKEFAPTFMLEDIVNLGFTQNYLRLMIDGIGSKPFSSSSLPPLPRPVNNYIADIVSYSREHYTLPKGEVEDAINQWTQAEYGSKVNFRNETRSEDKSNNFNSDKQLIGRDFGTRKDISNYDKTNPVKKAIYNPKYSSNNDSERQELQAHIRYNSNNKTNLSQTNTNQAKPAYVRTHAENLKIEDIKSDKSVDQNNNLGNLIKKAMKDKGYEEEVNAEKVEQREISKEKNRSDLRNILKSNYVEEVSSILKSDDKRTKAKSSARNIHFIETNSTDKSNSVAKKQKEEIPEDVLRALLTNE